VHLNLIRQYLYYSVEAGRVIRTPENGISRGGALSPQTGAILFTHLDRHFSGQPGLWNVRYMDDFLLLPEKRCPLRRAIADLNRYMNLDGFVRHPDKTQVGRLARGFGWCGVQFTAGQLPRISDRSLIMHRDRCRQPDEQLRARRVSEQDITARVSVYRVRWTIWADSIMLCCRTRCVR
jgi:hypothetical protein